MKGYLRIALATLVDTLYVFDLFNHSTDPESTKLSKLFQACFVYSVFAFKAECRRIRDETMVTLSDCRAFNYQVSLERNVPI
jgi:hypothetical protein